jgi:thiamine-monophosphate kinase
LTSRGEDAGSPDERGLIAHIRRRLPPPPSSMIVGPGDDAAVIVPARGALAVFTTDALVEGVHFDRRFSSPSDIGYKALAVNVSDIVAMGATPEFALLSLILPGRSSLDEVDGILDGVLEMAALARTAVAGGNISRSPGPLIVDVTVTGNVRPRRILTRSGGRPGDALFVTGSLGAAAAGLGWLKASGPTDLHLRQGYDGQARTSGPTDLMRSCVDRHLRPEPRLRAGLLLGRNRAASACMDLSDGLGDGVRQVAEASGTGALIDAALLPIDPAAAAWFREQGLDPVTSAISGGDDYELLFAVPRKGRGRLRAVQSAARGLPLTRIGELTADRDVLLTHEGRTGILPAGYTHF